MKIKWNGEVCEMVLIVGETLWEYTMDRKIWEEKKKRVVEGEKGRREKRSLGKGKKKMEQGERDRNTIAFVWSSSAPGMRMFLELIVLLWSP